MTPDSLGVDDVWVDDVWTDEVDDGPHEDDFPDLGLDDDPDDDERPGFLDPVPRVITPVLSVWGDRDGYRWSTSVPHRRDADHDQLAAEVELVERLDHLADVLVRLYRPALGERGRGKALLHLTGLSAAWLDAELGVGASTSSRLRDQVIRLPCGLVTIGFLTWVGPVGGQQPVPRALVDYAAAMVSTLDDDDDPALPAIERDIAVSHHLRPDTLYRCRRPTRLLLGAPSAVRSAQARLPSLVAAAEVIPGWAELRRPAEWIWRMFVAGCLDAELDLVERRPA